MRPQFITRGWNIVLPYSGTMMTVAGNVAGIVPTPTLRVWPWRSAIPRQIYIVGSRIGHQTAPTGLASGAGCYGQFAIAIDFNRAAFNAGVPPWYQQKPDGSDTDWDENLTLCSLFSRPSEPQERSRDRPHPVFFDADKDLLWIQQDAGDDQWFAQIEYLAPSPEVDVQPYPFVPPPGWYTVASVIPNADVSYTGYTFSVTIDDILAGGTAERITIAAGLTEGCTLNGLYIGPGAGHMAGSLTPVLSAPGVIAAGGELVVDVPVIDGGTVIRGYVSTGKVRSTSGPAIGWANAYKIGDFASQLSNAGFIGASAAANGVVKVEKLF